MIELEIDEGVAVLRLNAPERHNVLDDDVVEEVLSRLGDVERSEVGALVLTGAGGVFSAGGDLAHLDRLRDDLAAHGPGPLTRRLRRNAAVVERLRELPAVTVAAVGGACVGAALGWICACDLRVAAEAARFGSGFLRLGLSSDFGTAGLLASVIGRGRAADWLLRPRLVGAEEAYAAGLVSQIVPGDDLDARARALAAELAAVRVAATRMRANLDAAATSPFAEYLDAEASNFVESLESEAAGERISAVVARRRR